MCPHLTAKQCMLSIRSVFLSDGGHDGMSVSSVAVSFLVLLVALFVVTSNLSGLTWHLSRFGGVRINTM